MAKPFPEDRPFQEPVPESFRQFVNGGVDRADFGHDTLAKISLHYTQTACLDRVPGQNVFHYADMSRDRHKAVERLAQAIGIDDPTLISRVAEATSFSAMKANAENYAPVAGTGFWRSDAGFFDSASSQKWEGQLSEEDMELFDERLAELVPDTWARRWFENGDRVPA